VPHPNLRTETPPSIKLETLLTMLEAEKAFLHRSHALRGNATELAINNGTHSHVERGNEI
jgi:hypothetical protein